MARIGYLNVFVYEKIKKRIETGEFQFKSFLPSEKKLIEEYKVSRDTVRSALKMLFADKLVTSLPGKGWMVLNIINQIKPVAFISTFDTILTSTIAEPAINLLQKKGFKTNLFSKPNNKIPLSSILDIDNVSAISYMSGIPLDEKFVKEVNKKSIPLVCAGYAGESNRFDSISTNDYSAIEKMINELIKKGHKNICFLGVNLEDPAFEIRNQAFTTIMKEKKLIPQELILKQNFVDETDRDKIIEKIKSSKITAIVAASEVLADGVVSNLPRQGYNIPEFISVIGVSSGADRSDTYAYVKRLDASLIKQPWQEIGIKSAEVLMQRLKGEQSICGLRKIEPGLIEGKTICGLRKII